MAWSDYADLANKGTRDLFGVAVTYTPQGQAAQSITAIFDKAHEAVEVRAGVPVTTTRPMLDVRLADIAVAPRIGDTAVVDSTTYRVMEYQPTGNGCANLWLST